MDEIRDGVISMDRFDSHIEEPNVTCESCNASRPIGDMEFDEHAEIYLCDRQCFDDWHGDNAEKVGDYYYRMNIDY